MSKHGGKVSSMHHSGHRQMSGSRPSHGGPSSTKGSSPSNNVAPKGETRGVENHAKPGHKNLGKG